MMNVSAMVFLILASLITCWAVSPPQEKRISGEDVIVKQGHRVVVVEFVKDDGSTKIWISPDHHEINAKEKLSETMENSKERFSPKELVCDVYGKCKRKVLESAMGKAKEGGDEVVEEAYDEARDAKEEGMKDAASEAEGKFGEMKDQALEMVENASRSKGACGIKEGEKKELSDILRRAREVALDMFEYAMPPLSIVLVPLHLLGFSAAYGMCLWVTFASSHVLATALPRHQFSAVQSKIYPVYFKAMAYSVGMAFLGHLASSQTASPDHHDHAAIGIFQAFNLMTSILMILVNLLYLQPRATKVILERMKEEGRGKESGEKSEMLNSLSSLLNFMTLMSLTCHLLHLGRRLHSCC